MAELIKHQPYPECAGIHCARWIGSNETGGVAISVTND